MLDFIDSILDYLTLYKVVLFGLSTVALIAIILGFANILPFTGISLILSLIITFTLCFITNKLFSIIFSAPVNAESWGITALIIFLIMWPAEGVDQAVALALSSMIAMASKYILAINKKHIFNPTAFAVLVLALMQSPYPIWWVGSTVLLPTVFIIGLLVVRKIRRFNLFFSFLFMNLIFTITFALLKRFNIPEILGANFVSGPLIFFATIMLTEPQTTPPGKRLQRYYGALVGFLCSLQFLLGPFSYVPESALILGNIFSYLVSSKQRLILHLNKVLPLGPNLYEFDFTSDKKLAFDAGQYLEWTLPHKGSDLRGNRRYFTIASSPTEPDLKIGVKIIPEKSSSFKKALLNLNASSILSAGTLSGDFTLPTDAGAKLVFIAGGIGITPFRSMVKYLLDTNQRRDIVIFYTSLTPEDFVYRDIFDAAVQKLGVKMVYVVTDAQKAPNGWKGRVGYIDQKMIEEEVPDIKVRTFYLSGPVGMVNAYKQVLRQLKIKTNKIVTDYFAGYA